MHRPASVVRMLSLFACIWAASMTPVSETHAEDSSQVKVSVRPANSRLCHGTAVGLE